MTLNLIETLKTSVYNPKHIKNMNIQKMKSNPINALKTTTYNTKHTSIYKNAFPTIHHFRAMFELFKNKKVIVYQFSIIRIFIYFIYFIYFVCFVYLGFAVTRQHLMFSIVLDATQLNQLHDVVCIHGSAT